jgi:hypothetical protein
VIIINIDLFLKFFDFTLKFVVVRLDDVNIKSLGMATTAEAFVFLGEITR